MTQTVPNLRHHHRRFALSLEGWVVQLMEDYPGFDEGDLAQMVEEKTGVALDQRDFESLRGLYLRSKLRAWFPAGSKVWGMP